MSRTTHKTAPPADYMDLVRKFPLRPLRNAREYNTAAAIVDRFAVRAEGSLTAGEQDYLDALTLLIQAYDDEHFKLETQELGPLDLLKYLMSEHGMITADLGRLLGNRGLASLILNGRRELSKAHIRQLAAHFKVDAGLFIES